MAEAVKISFLILLLGVMSCTSNWKESAPSIGCTNFNIYDHQAELADSLGFFDLFGDHPESVRYKQFREYILSLIKTNKFITDSIIFTSSSTIFYRISNLSPNVSDGPNVGVLVDNRYHSYFIIPLNPPLETGVLGVGNLEGYQGYVRYINAPSDENERIDRVHQLDTLFKIGFNWEKVKKASRNEPASSDTYAVARDSLLLKMKDLSSSALNPTRQNILDRIDDLFRDSSDFGLLGYHVPGFYALLVFKVRSDPNQLGYTIDCFRLP